MNARRIEVATGGDPMAAFLAAVTEHGLAEVGEVVLLNVHHDDGCPCLDGRPMPACTCEIVHLDGSATA